MLSIVTCGNKFKPHVSHSGTLIKLTTHKTILRKIVLVKYNLYIKHQISKLALTFIPDSMNILNGISYLPSQLLFIKFNLLTNTFYDNNLTSMNSTK